MGHVYTTFSVPPEDKPVAFSPPNYDPMYGFPGGRKERGNTIQTPQPSQAGISPEMKVSEEEMISAAVPIDKRDYCAHHYINFMKCRKEKYPWVAGCKHELHLYDDCEFQDYVLRMKEFERERRLMMRERRKIAASASEELE